MFYFYYMFLIENSEEYIFNISVNSLTELKEERNSTCREDAHPSVDLG